MSGEPNQVKWRGVQPVDGIRGVWPARNAVRVNKYGEKNGLGQTNFYTVPAEKMLLISSCYLATRLSVDGFARCSMFTERTGPVAVLTITHHIYDKAGQQISTQTFSPALEVAAGEWVGIFNNNTDMNSYAGFCGWLEDE